MGNPKFFDGKHVSRWVLLQPSPSRSWVKKGSHPEGYDWESEVKVSDVESDIVVDHRDRHSKVRR